MIDNQNTDIMKDVNQRRKKCQQGGNSVNKYIENGMKYQPLLGELVARDIKIKYRRSVLGVFWTLLNPLCMMAVLSVVYSNLFKFSVDNFPLYLLSGQVIFNFYSEATTSAMGAIIGNSALIKKVYMPKYLFVVSRIISSAINLGASFCALIVVMAVTRAELNWTILFSWIPLVFLILFSVGVGLALAALTVKFRDIMHLYSVFITALMYLTPVIYPMSILPSWLAKIVLANPITNIIMMFRDTIMYASLPGLTDLVIAAVESIVMLAIGMYVFYKNQDEFILNI